MIGLIDKYMRWTNKIKPRKPSKILVGNKPPIIGDTIQIIKFAFLPTNIDNNQIIWLEKYIDVYIYGKKYVPTNILELRPNYTRKYITTWKFKERKIYDRKNFM